MMIRITSTSSPPAPIAIFIRGSIGLGWGGGGGGADAAAVVVGRGAVGAGIRWRKEIKRFLAETSVGFHRLNPFRVRAGFLKLGGGNKAVPRPVKSNALVGF